MAQARRGARSEARRLADLVQEAVDDGARTAEEIHKAIAELPLDVLERLDVFEQTVKNVKRIQDSSIGAVYDVIRRINREVAGLAREILELAPPRKPAPKKKARPRRPAPKAGRAAARA